MTKEEKFTSVTVYLAKVVDELKGIEDEPRLLSISQLSPKVAIGRMKEISEVAITLEASFDDTLNTKRDATLNRTDSDSQMGSESARSEGNK